VVSNYLNSANLGSADNISLSESFFSYDMI